MPWLKMMQFGKYLQRPGKLLLTFAVFAIFVCAAGWVLRTGVSTNPNVGAVDPATAARYAQLRSPSLDMQNPPVEQVNVNYAQGKSAPWYPRGESPILHQLVEQGKLPPVASRVGPEPAVYRGAGGIGHYGGDLYLIVKNADDVRLFLQYELDANTFTRFSSYGRPIRPNLARKVVPSDDYRVWTVTLRKGVKWSDGKPFTAADVMFWWKHVANDPQIGSIPETMRVNGKPGTIVEVNRYKLKFIFPAPNPNWPQMMAGPSGELYMPGPKHYLEQFHPTLGNQKLIHRLCAKLMISPAELFWQKESIMNPQCPRLSPWILTNSQSNGMWTAVRNPYYFAVDTRGNQLPYIDRIVFRQISPQLQLKAVINGVPSYAALNSDQHYTSLMDNRRNGQYYVRQWYAVNRSQLTIIPNRHLPVHAHDPSSLEKARLLQNPVFRRALSIAINRRRIIEAAFKGIGKPRELGPGPASPWYEKGYGKINAQYDPAEANHILDSLGLTKRNSAGYRMLPDGHRLIMVLICGAGSVGPLQFVIDDWRAVGLHVILEEKPHRLYMSMSGLVSLTVGTGGSADSWEALGAGAPYWQWYYAGGMYHSKASQASNLLKPHGIEIKAMRLGQEAANTADMASKINLAHQVMKIAAQQVWTISLATAGPKLAMVKDNLLGVPTMLKAGFSLDTPGNGIPETWYWKNPRTINGVDPASAAYLTQRRASIIHEILHSTAASQSGLESASARSGFLNAGHLIQYVIIAIVILLLVLLILRHPFVLQRMLIMVPTLTLISIIVFVAVQLPPGNYLDSMILQMQRTGQESQIRQQVQRLDKMYHLKDGPVTNYLRWTGVLWFWTHKASDEGLLEGNLGRSMANHGAFVNTLIGDRLLLTIIISAGAILFTWLIALPIGIYSAVRQYSAADYVLTVLGFVGMCVPDFLLALILMLVARALFNTTINGLFSSEFATQSYWNLAKVQDLMAHLWVPVIVVGAGSTAGMIRVMRANLLDELRKPYVVTARAKGVPPIRLLLKYPIRLALNPFIAGIGQVFPALISGTAIVSIILSLPTIGPLLLNAVMLEDTYMASSLLLCLSALSVFGMLVSDLLLLALDPRIRLSGGTR